MRSLWIVAAYTLAISIQSFLRQFDTYTRLYERFPFFVPETLKALLGVTVCVIVAVALYGRGDHFALRPNARRGLLFGLAASSPMLVAFAFTRSVRVEAPVAAFFLVVLFPFTEEVISRGFAFRLLHNHENWPWWMAAGAVGLVTGSVHMEKGQTALQVLGLFAVTGLGGAVFSWLLARWRSLWFPFALHAFMNLWWEVFSVSRTALGGWFAFAAQIACVVAALVITLRMTPSLAETRRQGETAERGVNDGPLQFAGVS